MRWDERLDSEVVEAAGGHVPLGSYIVHISDRIAVRIDRTRDVLSQSGSIRDRIARESGAMFMPELVDVFEELANREYFWLDLSSPSVGSVLHKRMHKADRARFRHAPQPRGSIQANDRLQEPLHGNALSGGCSSSRVTRKSNRLLQTRVPQYGSRWIPA